MNFKNFLFIYLLSLIVQFSFFIFFSSKNNNYIVCTDSSEYIAISENIYNSNGMKKIDGDFNFRRLPGYPIFLSFCYKILHKIDIKKALIFQIILSSFIPILMFFLSISLFPGNFLLANMVSIFSIFNLGFILYSGMVLSDSIFLLLFLLFLILFISRKNFIVQGLILGVVSLIRPVGHYLLFISLLILIFIFRENIKKVTQFFIGWFLPVFPWLLRNLIFTGSLFFHTLPGIHFLIYTAAYIKSDVEKIDYSHAKSNLLGRWEKKINNEELKSDNSYDIKSCKIAEKIAFDYIKKHPILFFKHSFIHMFKTMFSLHSSTLLFMDSRALPNYTRETTLIDKAKRFLFPSTTNYFLKTIIYLEIFFLLFVLLGFIGFIINSLFCQKFLQTILIVLPFIFLFIFITLAYGCARLRLPIEPLMIILSFHYWINLIKTRRFLYGKERV